MDVLAFRKTNFFGRRGATLGLFLVLGVIAPAHRSALYLIALGNEIKFVCYASFIHLTLISRVDIPAPCLY